MQRGQRVFERQQHIFGIFRMGKIQNQQTKQEQLEKNLQLQSLQFDTVKAKKYLR